MAVVLRLMRAGAKKRPFYRVVAADSRRQRDGRFLEIVGHYDPLRTPYELVIEKDHVEKWLSRGAARFRGFAAALVAVAAASAGFFFGGLGRPSVTPALRSSEATCSDGTAPRDSHFSTWSFSMTSS